MKLSQHDLINLRTRALNPNRFVSILPSQLIELVNFYESHQTPSSSKDTKNGQNDILRRITRINSILSEQVDKHVLASRQLVETMKKN